jgi:hypothetical protein
MVDSSIEQTQELVTFGAPVCGVGSEKDRYSSRRFRWGLDNHHTRIHTTSSGTACPNLDNDLWSNMEPRSFINWKATITLAAWMPR